MSPSGDIIIVKKDNTVVIIVGICVAYQLEFKNDVDDTSNDDNEVQYVPRVSKIILQKKVPNVSANWRKVCLACRVYSVG